MSCQTIIVAAATYIVLPNNIDTAKFLNEEERITGLSRLRGVEHGTGKKERFEIWKPVDA
jgi:hypothetical protein